MPGQVSEAMRLCGMKCGGVLPGLRLCVRFHRQYLNTATGDFRIPAVHLHSSWSISGSPCQTLLDAIHISRPMPKVHIESQQHQCQCHDQLRKSLEVWASTGGIRIVGAVRVLHRKVMRASIHFR